MPKGQKDTETAGARPSRISVKLHRDIKGFRAQKTWGIGKCLAPQFFAQGNFWDVDTGRLRRIGKIPICKAKRLTNRFLGSPPSPHNTIGKRKKVLNIRRTKSKQINIRATQADYDKIKQKAESAGQSTTEYLTTLALNGKIIIIPGWQDAAKELSAIGNNLNQLTRLCHDKIITCPELTGTKEEIAKVWQLLNSQAEQRG